jgi:hypothetical protein
MDEMTVNGTRLKTLADFGGNAQDYVDYQFLTGMLQSIKMDDEGEFGWHKLDSECDSRTRLLLDRFERVLRQPVLRVAVAAPDLGGDICAQDLEYMLSEPLLRETRSGLTFYYHMAAAMKKATGTTFILDPGFSETAQILPEWAPMFQGMFGLPYKTAVMEVAQVPAYLAHYRSILHLPTNKQSDAARRYIAGLMKKTL